MAEQAFLLRQNLEELFSALIRSGYRVIGPMVSDGAIIYTDLHTTDSLPAGYHLEATPGSVRISMNGSTRCFAWSNGPQALKPLLFRSSEPLWQVKQSAGGSLQFESIPADAEAIAVIGVRACDLAALDLLDRHFLNEKCSDPQYAARRDQLFLIAVNCTHPAGTCFCASTGDGPGVSGGYDLLLDELDDGFIVTAGSEAGSMIVAELGIQPVKDTQIHEAADAVSKAARKQTRTIPEGNLFALLAGQKEHPRWSDVAERCLACGNCTLVCPSCFCSREQEHPQLDGSGSVHVREWDSCFTEGHSYIAGLVVRSETRHRYRQWLTHKLGSWHHQYGRSGCVGCGRCIAWCPVGIDITEEVGVILDAEHAG